MLNASAPPRPRRRWAALLAAPLLCFASSAWAAPHDLVLQIFGPTSAAVTSTAQYQVRLNNTHPTFQGEAASVQAVFTYQATNVEFTTATFSNGVTGTCTDSTPKGTVTCTLSNIPYGFNNQAVEFNLNVTGAGLAANWTGGGVAINPTATVSSDDDRVSTNNSESRNTTITPGTDLGVTLTSSPSTTMVSGQTWTHNIVVINNGPLNTTNAKVTVAPSGGQQWAATGQPAGCTLVGANLECTIPGTFNNGANYTFTGLKSVATTGGGGSLTATASVSSALPDLNTANNSDSTSVAVTPGTDLKLAMSQSGCPVVAGGQCTVTVTPRYSGDVPTNPSFTVTLPSNVSPVGGAVNPTGWSGCSWAGQTLACTTWTGTGTPGVDRPMGSVSFPVTSSVPNTYTINGAISGNGQPEADNTNNTAQVPVTFQPATSNVTIAKSGPVAPYNKFTRGATISYTVRLRNTAPNNVPYAQLLSFTESPPAGLTITGITTADSGWNCTPTGCSKDYASLGTSLAVDGSVAFTVTATVDTDSGLPLTNRVCRAAYTHPAVGSTTALACANAGAVSGNPVSGGTDLSITKTQSTTTVAAGDWLTYTLVVGNTTEPATDAIVRDTLANLVTDGSPSFEMLTIPSGWACTNGSGGTAIAQGSTLSVSTVNLDCTRATFPASSSDTFSFRIRPLGTAASGASRNRNNTATVQSSTQEANFGNNTATTSNVAVTAQTDFTISKAVTNGWNGTTGTELQYTITVTNRGRTSGANNVVVTDVLPENVTYLGIQGSSLPTCAGLAANAVTSAGSRTLTCTWSTFDSSPTADVERSFIVRIRPNHEWQGKTLVNNAYVNVQAGTTTPIGGSTPETNYNNNHAQASTAANEANIDLQVDKRDLSDPVFVGDTVDYEVVITNHGPSVATNAKIYDYLPVKGFTWAGNVRFFNVNGDGSRGTQIMSGASCSKTPSVGAHGTGGEDETNPNKLNWLWPMNVTGATPGSPNYNPNYVNGQWDTRIATQADIICEVGNMLPAAQVMLVYTLTAKERGVYMNHSIVRSQEHIDRLANGFADSVWNNDAIQRRTTVRSRPDVDLVKAVSKSPVALREPFTYTITVTNKLTAEPAYAPQVRDALPANMELTGVPTLTSGAADLTGGTFACNAPPAAPAVPPAVGAASKAGDTAFVCTLGTGVKPGAAVTITVPVRVVGGGATTLTNKAALHLDTDLVFDSEPPPVVEDDVPVNVVVSSIAGNVYHDANDNGVKDAGEAPISGVTVTLTGTDDYGNPVNMTATTTGGAYKFDNLAPGNYTVTETHPNTWMDGKDTVGVFGPAPGSGTAGNDVIGSIALPADTHGTEYNFGELRPLPGGQTTASISGYVYHDVNNDGVKDPGEAPIPGVTITLTGNNGDVRTTTTDANGFYQFTGLEPGATYTVVETQPSSWTDGKDTAGTVFTDGGGGADDRFQVTPGSGEDGLNWNFGERRTTPSGPASIPTLSEWGLIVLSMLLAAFALRRMPLRTGRRM